MELLDFSYRFTLMSSIAAEFELLLLTLSQIQTANYSQGLLWAISSLFAHISLTRLSITVVAALTVFTYDTLLTIGDEVGSAKFSASCLL